MAREWSRRRRPAGFLRHVHRLAPNRSNPAATESPAVHEKNRHFRDGNTHKHRCWTARETRDLMCSATLFLVAWDGDRQTTSANHGATRSGTAISSLLAASSRDAQHSRDPTPDPPGAGIVLEPMLREALKSPGIRRPKICRLRLAPVSGISALGDVAEWLKAAVC